MINNLYLSPFIAIQRSPWPFLISFALFSLLINTVLWINLKVTIYTLLFSFLLVLLIRSLWWKDLNREGLLGYHTHKLELRIRVGMLLFILSEVFFFLRFFWAFYDASISPTCEIGMSWPPKGIVSLSAYSVPLLNTAILLTRGITVTWAHHRIINNFYIKSLISLLVTVLLGVYFLIMQWVEYNETQFRIADRVYGRTFFIATGFHGIHVLIGTTFLLVCLGFLAKAQYTYNHHFTFEAAAWYWHFVDVVWLFLFISVYWWGGL